MHNVAMKTAAPADFRTTKKEEERKEEVCKTRLEKAQEWVAVHRALVSCVATIAIISTAWAAVTYIPLAGFGTALTAN